MHDFLPKFLKNLFSCLTCDRDITSLLSKMKIKLPLFAVSCLILASSCAHHIHPGAVADIDSNLRNGTYKIQEFHGSSTVTLVNGQPDTEQYIIYKAGVHSFYGDGRELTNTDIRLSEGELTKRGLHVADKGKKVTMIVESMEINHGWTKSKAKAVLKVQIEGGFSATYTANDIGIYDSNICSETLVGAVAQMLNDKRFVAAVTK